MGKSLIGAKMKTGNNVRIHPTVQIFGEDNIEIGDNVRIDAFSILSGGIGLKIGSNIHIAAYNSFYAGGGIVIEDFCQFAPHCLIMSQSDDFSGESLVGPCVPDHFKPNLKINGVLLKKHTVLGARTTVMQGVTMGEGSATGAHSLVLYDCDEWSIYVGTPARKLKERSRKMLELEKEFTKWLHYKA